MKLITPSEAFAADFLVARDEMKQQAEGIWFWDDLGSPASVEEYIAIRANHARGENLPPGWVPANTFWLIDEGRFIGETTIRRELTEFLRTVGGNIGYWIRPPERQKGYGTELLRLGLQKARELGLEDVLITCDETNVGSRKIIEANGGVFEVSRDMGPVRPPKLLFWFRA